MGILDEVELSAMEKAERGLPLPDRLSIYEIAELWWSDNKRNFEIYGGAIYSAFKNGKLPGHQASQNPYSEGILGPYTHWQNIAIHRDDFLA